MNDTARKPFNFKRLVVAAVVLPMLVSYLYFLPADPYFLVLIILVNILAMREFHAMYSLPLVFSMPALILGAGLFYVMCFYPFHIVEALFISFFVLMFLRLVLAKATSGTMAELGVLATGYIYITSFLVFQWFLRRESSGVQYIFLLYTSVWLADSTAYYVGSYLGRHKLTAISPNKTYEGVAGSILGGSAGAVAVSYLYGFEDLSLDKALIVGAVLGGITVAGDLVESMFKRDAGVKDSGSIFPGHGGILDKLDGVLVAGPLLYFILRWI